MVAICAGFLYRVDRAFVGGGAPDTLAGLVGVGAAGNQRANHKLSLVARACLICSCQIRDGGTADHVLSGLDDLASCTFAIVATRDVKIGEHRKHRLDGNLPAAIEARRLGFSVTALPP